LLKKVLLFPTRYFPSISGAEFYFQRIGEILREKRLKNLDILTSNAIDFKALRSKKGKSIQSDSKYYHKVNNVEINRYPINYKLSFNEKLERLHNIPAFADLNLSEQVILKFLKNGPYISNFSEILTIINNKKYDLIHTTYFPYLNLIYALVIGKAMEIPVVCTPFFHFSNPRYKDPYLMEILKKFDLLISCTNTEKEFLVSKANVPSRKIKVIPMGVDYKIFKEIGESKFLNYSFKEKFFKKDKRHYKMVLFCGYKNYEKGAISVLKAIPYIKNEIKEVYFVFIGPSTKAYNFELKNNNSIKKKYVLNFTPDNLSGYFDKIKLTAFKESDVYLMPSRSDAFGIAFLEAWASGKPVIGANMGATPEVIRDGVDGFLVEFDDPKDIAKKVVKLLKNKHMCKKFGENGEIKVKKYFTWEKISRRTNQLYNKIIKKNNNLK
jgi:glycosyltransferase involved in cell wall biosynthesis